MKQIEIFEGNFLNQDYTPPASSDAKIAFIGHNQQYVPLTEEILSRHVMILDGIGTGKTNAFYQLIYQLDQTKQDEDVFIIFDTKGEYYEDFYRPGDVVISNDATATGPEGEDYWNIFAEIDPNNYEESIMEIANTLFYEKIKNASQPFFPSAARDLFQAMLIHFYRHREDIEATNKIIREFIDVADARLFRDLLSNHPDLQGLTSYIYDDSSGQAQGILSELQQTLRQIFIGNFKKSGTLGMTDLLDKKQGRKIFIEYDMALGKTLSPIYTLLFDLAIKKALSRSKAQGNVYFITDEFSLVPHLSHVEDAVNFGRSLGVKYFIGIQNIEQIVDIYGEHRTKSLLSGFLTSVIFRLNEVNSREYVKELCGKNRKKEIFQSSVSSRGIVEQIRDANVVEDWDISSLGTGEAIIRLPTGNPFLFKFKKM